MTKLPINLDVLIWARTSLNLSQDEVAKRLGKKFKATVIEQWESGSSSPTYPQLEKLAYEVYKRPVAVFFFPHVPKEDTPKTEFRMLPASVTQALPPEIVKAYRKAKAFQYNLDELYEGARPASPSLIEQFPLKNSSQISQVARHVRQALGVAMDQQAAWRNPEEAFKVWRSALESRGVFVFKDAFHNDDYSGFCAHDDKYPLIYVNNSMSDSRQVFTLFHELCHLLYGSGGIDFRDRSIPESFGSPYAAHEKDCNQFANEVLVPSAVFDHMALDVSEKRFEELADYFSVSREVILRNYLDRQRVTHAYYDRIMKKWKEQVKASKSSGGNYHLTQKAYLGENYINLAFGKYYQNRISIESLADYLNVKVKNIGNFEHYAVRGGLNA